MAVDKQDIQAFVSGTHNLLSDEIIPDDAASNSLGWLTEDGHIELMCGRQLQGQEGAAGKVWEKHTAYKTDNTPVFFRKIWDGTEGKVQYLNGATWTDVLTGLSEGPMTFTNYSSLSGNYVYFGSANDGLYKVVTANPADAVDVYDATKNFKGYMLIDKGRMFMWATETDSTGLYGSHIDAQDSDVYTTVSAEAIGSLGSTNYTGTLGFKSGGSTRTCFGVTFTDGTQTITIDYTGNAEADADGTGTVNLATGAYDVTFTATTTGAVTATYQWEDSNVDGVTDFSKSATRLAGEGFTVRQDKGGDPIKTVIVHDGSYFSFKENSVYQFTLDAEDLNPTNQLIRADVGINTLHAAVATGLGILYLDTSNPTKPQVQMLKRNPVGDNFDTEPVFKQFAFENYNYDDVVLEVWDEYLIIACREDSDTNNRILMCNFKNGTVDVAPYNAASFCKDEGVLYAGGTLSLDSYELFTGFDDLDLTVQNYWESKGDTFGTSELKKVKKLRFRGQIDPNQSIKVSVMTDDGDYQHVGTILGSGDYVDYQTSFAVGTSFIGQDTIGGGGVSNQLAYNFLMQIKVRLGKFRKRKIKFEALGYGYCRLEQMTDFDVWLYEDKLPKKYRQKQNVSLDGATTNQDSPQY